MFHLLVAVAVCGLFILFLFVYRLYRHRKCPVKTESVALSVVLGSGGHTTEMLRLVSALSLKHYQPRTFILSETDSTSLTHLQRIPGAATAVVHKIPRSREVRQSYITSVQTTLIALWKSLWLFRRLKTDVLLCNGPGTCIPACAVLFFLDLCFMRTCRIIFVESLCRVETLSSTGKILYHLGIADAILVQWQQLHQKYPSTVYIGRLV